jgi:type IV pilus assembly protein PilQ
MDPGTEKKPEAEKRRETDAPQGPREKTPPEKPPSPAAFPPAKPLEEPKPIPPPGKPEAERPGVKIYSGEKITLDFIEADIHRVLALISEAAKRQIVPSAEVRGTITLRLIDVPWDQALDAILSIHNLKKVEEGNLIRIFPRDKS